MEEVCADCGFDQSTTPPREVATALPPLALAISDSLRILTDDELRRRPASTVWSPLEYLGHLRESMAFHRWLIERALTEDNPVVAMVDPDESVALASYNDTEREMLIGQFDRRIQRLGDALISLDSDAAGRTLALGDRQISVALVARSAWHECHHHLGDIRRTVSRAPSP
ncbi:DinB family protein [Mycobacterium deserti]|uniref:DinB family protein n=1 Tax=Mycobacterium deserti TaxID=2978347 RepID=A0ABT2M641_9MYCO|nr:DinB family protein [Mycobacterium deserti]MCT7657099.1 DinB family protein [Mycobacterium deserti]